MAVDHPAWVGIGIFVAYTAIVAVLWRATGTRYDRLVDTREHVLRGIVIPIGIGGLFLAIAATLLGWWHEALFLDERVGPAWMIAVPALFGLAALINIASIGWRTPAASRLPLIALGTLLVGFAEEMATRGLLVAGLREAGAGILVIWLVSSVLFALLHGINVLYGQSGRATIIQVVMTFFAGSALYATLLATGTLLVGIVLHALWDLGTLGIQATERQQKPVAGVIGLASLALAVVALVVVVTT